MGCARNVPQDSGSGKDLRPKGAKKMEIEGGEARTRDIITYPGGDRVDWKLLTLPEGQKGRLKIRLKFKPARPGMDVAFVVYDEWFHPVGQAKPSKKGDDRSKSVKVKDAKGKYYIQVYAPRRMDAAKYTLSAEFKEEKAPIAATDTDLLAQVDEPPALPAIPPPPVAATQPATGPGPVTGPGPTEPEPDPAAVTPATEPMKAKVVKVQVASDGGGVIVTINKGTKDGIDRGWQGNVLQGTTGTPLDGGDFKVIKVTARESVARIKLTIDQVRANSRVLLTPP